MKKQILVFSAFLIVALFTACEQDSLISTDVSEEVITELSLESEPELAALINSEYESSEIEERCSFNGSVAASKTGQSGYPGIYSGKYRVTANNNPFPPANQYVTYRVTVWQKKNNHTMVQKGEPVCVNGHTLSWNSPMYYATNGYSRWVYFLVEARSSSCNSWKSIGHKWMQL